MNDHKDQVTGQDVPADVNSLQFIIFKCANAVVQKHPKLYKFIDLRHLASYSREKPKILNKLSEGFKFILNRT